MNVTKMKLLEILIPEEDLRDINEILHKHKVGGMSSFSVKGRGRLTRQALTINRGTRVRVPQFGFRTKVEVLVPDTLAKAIINDIMENAKDLDLHGKIFVYNVNDAYDIGAKQQGESAL